MITDFDVETEGEEPTENSEDAANEEILRVAKERFKICQEAYADQHKRMVEDLKFADGDQWEADAIKSRQEDGRPTLTINRMPGFIHQLSNDIRQNRPAIKVSPVDSLADIETAKVRQGMIRHIEYSSNADNAYDTGADSAIRGGLGWWRILTRYQSPLSFKQEIYIKRVPDALSVMLDPSFQEPDGSDAAYGFVSERVQIDNFKALFPKAKISTDATFNYSDENLADWVDKSSVRVAEYYYIDFVSATLYLLGDGSVTTELVDGMLVVDSRPTVIPKVKWAKINGCEILEKRDVSGQWIPLIPVLGEETFIEGKRVLSGIVRHAKDPQRMYNFWKSAETEAIANAPRAPYIGPEGTFEGHEAQWKLANKKNISYLQYKPIIKNGALMPPPQRQTFEPAIQAITQAAMLAADDMKATTSIYDAAMGARSNEASGIAINNRARQAQTSNFHFVDNLSKSIRHTGRIIDAWMEDVYDTDQEIRILGEDMSEEIVRVNAQYERKGQLVMYDLAAGKYDITVSVGPSYETKRQEAVQSQLEFLRVAPHAAPAVSHLIAKNMDWQGAEEMAKALRAIAPAPIQALDEKGADNKIPPQVQGQLQQQQMMIQQLTQALNVANSETEKLRLQHEQKKELESMKLELQAAIELAKLQQKDAGLLLTSQMRQLDSINKQQNQILAAEMPAGGPDQAPVQAFEQNQQLPGEFPPVPSMEIP